MAPPPGAPTFQLAGMQPEVLAQAQLPPVAPNAVLAPNETRRLAALAAVSPDRRAVLLRKACVAYEEARKQVQELTSKLEAMPKQAAELQARLQAAYTDSALPTEAQAKANSLRRAKARVALLSAHSADVLAAWTQGRHLHVDALQQDVAAVQASIRQAEHVRALGSRAMALHTRSLTGGAGLVAWCAWCAWCAGCFFHRSCMP